MRFPLRHRACAAKYRMPLSWKIAHTTATTWPVPCCWNARVQRRHRGECHALPNNTACRQADMLYAMPLVGWSVLEAGSDIN
jgi:hypothetical protein